MSTNTTSSPSNSVAAVAAQSSEQTPSTPPSPSTPSTPSIPRIKVLSDSFIKNYPVTASRGCFVLGATGECGKRLARDLINSGAFSLVKLIARRPVPGEFVPEPPAGVKIEQVIIPDFNTIDENSKIFQGCDFGFCALGTTKKNAGGEEEFFKIDHDLTLKLLSLAKSSGCKYLALISSAGAAASSIFLYPKTKGLLENDVIDLKFEALRIYRPAMIQVKRKEERIGEEIFLIFAPLFDFCSLGRAAIKIDTLIDSIVKDSLIYGSSGNIGAEKHLVFIGNKAIKAIR